MSIPTGSRIRDGIWEIGDYEIIAHFPEGDWRLTSLDIESIRLEPDVENGRPVCDAFLKARNQPRSDLMGRYTAGEDHFCVELALYAARNRIRLIGEPLPKTAAPQGLMPTGKAPGHDSDPMPTSPDTAFEVQYPPHDPVAFQDANQVFGRNQGPDPAFDPGKEGYPDQAFDPNKGDYPNQAFNPEQPYGFHQGFEPGREYPQGPGFNPHGSFNFRSPDWWRWNYDRNNPSFRRNLLLTILFGFMIMGIVGAIIANGAPIFSGPGLIFLIIILSNRKKGRRRR